MDFLFLILVFLNSGFLFSEAVRPSFSVFVSDDFLLVGRSVKITQKTTVTEATPFRYKIKLPFNETAYMRILGLTVQTNDSLQITGNKVPNLTSSSGDENLIDEATFDLGQVTPSGSMDIVVTFVAQLLDHPKLTNGEKVWISIGAEFTNGSIWANQLAVSGFKNFDPEPVLKGSAHVPQMDQNEVVTGSTVDINFRLTHDPIKTTSIASGINITFFHPPYLVFDSMAKDPKSVHAQVISNSISTRTLSVGSFNFSEVAHFNMTFQVDPAKTKPRGQVHAAFVRIEVKYSFTSPFYPDPREMNMKKALQNTIKFYPQRDSCDVALAVADENFEASSYSTEGPPKEGKLNGPKAWVPVTALKKDRNQFIGVNFTGLKIIHRIAVQGSGDGLSTSGYVTGFRVFYSKDCAMWTLYKNKDNIKYLKGNTAANKMNVVPLDPPIEAKCIRINPTAFNKQISLRFELYGCASSNPTPAALLKSRTFLLDTATNTIYACNIPMLKKSGQASCYYSSDSGTAWTAFDHNVLNIKMINPDNKRIYGLGLRGSHFSCTAQLTIECMMISAAEYDKVKVLPGVIFAKEANKISVTDDPNSKIPVEADSFTHDGKKLGASPLGIHWYDGAWNQKTSWAFGE
ncbi:uncharacterized protein LOC116296282 isoform X2 [Actinia tenebrosa]|uniref:Uncharacterized protein LOC116296282 isoform X2 n=1 Tax=Actinia tenebrosa TaxID=6105 RepID=A0A6P8I5C6_ACTTE|nr:uncharacterized protein LOC116296282 isoform X2 [Actinia tenebrosa]